jgi:hypothetical protein
VVVVGETDSLPVVALVPLQPPLAVQVVSPLVVQSMVLDWPAVIVVGVAVNATAGGGVAEKVTVTESAALPPSPAQVRV